MVQRHPVDFMEKCPDEGKKPYEEYMTEKWFTKDRIATYLNYVKCIDSRNIFVQGEPEERTEASVYIALQK